MKNPTLQKQCFPKLLKELLDVLQLNVESTLQNGFKKCGILPCKADELLSRLPQSLNISSNVEESSIEHLQKTRSETTQTNKQKRKKLKVTPGMSYAHEEHNSDEPTENEVVADDTDISCPVSENGKYSIDDFVIFRYNETLYPGRIINVTED